MDAVPTWILAARAFADLVEQLPGDRWDASGLGVWSLRDLVGHTTSAGIRTVATALDQPSRTEAITSPEGYYALAKTVAPAIFQSAVVASTTDARETGASLGDDPATTVRLQVDRTITRLEAIVGELLIDTAAGGMRLTAWLPTRTFELAVHHLDIAAAAGVAARLPDVVVADAAALAARIAAAVGDGHCVLLAMTGRGRLPETFSVV